MCVAAVQPGLEVHARRAACPDAVDESLQQCGPEAATACVRLSALVNAAADQSTELHMAGWPTARAFLADLDPTEFEDLRKVVLANRDATPPTRDYGVFSEGPSEFEAVTQTSFGTRLVYERRDALTLTTCRATLPQSFP